MGAACAAGGLALSDAGAEPALAAAACAAAVLAALRAPLLGALGPALILLGFFVGAARLAAIDVPAAKVRDEEHVTIRAHLLTRPRPSDFGATAEIRAAGGKLGGVRLLLRIPRWSRLPPGTMSARSSPWPDRCDRWKTSQAPPPRPTRALSTSPPIFAGAASRASCCSTAPGRPDVAGPVSAGCWIA